MASSTLASSHVTRAASFANRGAEGLRFEPYRSRRDRARRERPQRKNDATPGSIAGLPRVQETELAQLGSVRMRPTLAAISESSAAGAALPVPAGHPTRTPSSVLHVSAEASRPLLGRARGGAHRRG